MGSITAKELARLLHLSESAVSLALNDRPGVSRETRKRVLEAAREHDFDFSRKAVSRDPSHSQRKEQRWDSFPESVSR